MTAGTLQLEGDEVFAILQTIDHHIEELHEQMDWTPKSMFQDAQDELAYYRLLYIKIQSQLGNGP